MKLLKLYSNRNKFKPVNFNEDGLTIIVGADSKENASDHHSTYNGTGKTLILLLVDFCLVSNRMPSLAKLNCKFSLDFKIGNIVHTISRSTEGKQENFIIDNVPIEGVKIARNKLSEMLEFEQEYKISLRSLLPFLLRYKATAYLSPENPGDGSKDDSWNYILTYLLGFDTSYGEKKYNLRTKLDEQNTLKRTLNDKEVKLLLNKNSNVDLELKKLKSDLSDLENKQVNFQVAENMNELKEELNLVRIKMRQVTNNVIISENNIRKIEKAISEKINIDFQEVKKVYDEVIEIFDDKINKSLQDVQIFQEKLIVKRNERLSVDLEEYKIKHSSSKIEQKNISEKINELYNIINTHGSFIELNALNKKIVIINQQISKLSRYQEISKEVQNSIIELKSKFAESNVEAQNYLTEQLDSIQQINSYFSEIIEYLYGENGGGLINITNNVNSSAFSRFQIQTQAYRDDSDGINNMKIFAFNLLLLNKGNSPFEFIVFDNKIFYGVDANQSSAIIKYIHENIVNDQVIFCINQSDYDAIYQKLESEHSTNLLTDFVNLELTSSEEGTLLGEYIDLKLKDI